MPTSSGCCTPCSGSRIWTRRSISTPTSWAYDYPSGEFTLAFVGYGDEESHAVIELTHNWGEHAYDIGSAYGHIAIAVPDIYRTCDELAAQGVKIPRPAGPMKHGGRPIAFIEDPDGYKIELVERS
jgi:lactoylglutathione lyase